MAGPRSHTRFGRTILLFLATGAAAVTAAQQSPRQTPSFGARTDFVYVPARAYGASGNFIPDLRAADFEVFEDGVRQTVTSFSRTIGGRVLPDAGAAPPAREGIVMPRSAAPPAEGRLFIIFIDDLHVRFQDTQRLKQNLAEIRDTTLHPNDWVGIVSSGYSSIAFDLNPDPNHIRMNEAIKRAMGSGRDAREIVNSAQTINGPAGLRHDTMVAFKLAYDILGQAEKVTDRQKAFIWLSSGYDFNPYADARWGAAQQMYGLTPPPVEQGRPQPGADPITQMGQSTPTVKRNPYEMNGQQFAEADLMTAVGELVARARRANVQIWTLDPRGLAGGVDMSIDLGASEVARHENTRLNSLDVIARGTGGQALTRSNDVKPGLRRLDNALSDYYMLGYQSTNPDPLHVLRKIVVKVKRPDVKSVTHKESYSIKR